MPYLHVVRLDTGQLFKRLLGLCEPLSCNKTVRQLTVCIWCVRENLQGKASIVYGFIVFHKALLDAGSFKEQLVVELVVIFEHAAGKLLSEFEVAFVKETLQIAFFDFKCKFVLHLII